LRLANRFVEHKTLGILMFRESGTRLLRESLDLLCMLEELRQQARARTIADAAGNQRTGLRSESFHRFSVFHDSRLGNGSCKKVTALSEVFCKELP
jgi:hypothetical protein